MQYETSNTRVFCYDTNGTVPIDKASLSECLVDTIRTTMGISSLFRMQSDVLSHILDVTSKRQVGDVVLCAPTGSGKTLAYALPIVQSLIGRKIARLRGIIVVPTRDLALQVGAVFKALTEKSLISVAIITGSQSIARESSLLKSAEILIATPGRLVDHIDSTEGFGLRGVRYLVLDESDRLLQESYQDWLDAVIPLLGTSSVDGRERTVSSFHGPGASVLALALHPDVSGRSIARNSQNSSEYVRKILVSATQTRNPMRLVKLGLRQPVFFEPSTASNGDRDTDYSGYTVPSSLKERGWVLPSIGDKPVALLQILGWIHASNRSEIETVSVNSDIESPPDGTKLIFTKSVEAAHRLAKLLELCAYRLGKNDIVLEMSGELSARRREDVLMMLRGECPELIPSSTFRSLVVVCSDVLSRGMDIFKVDNIINYDAPVHIRTYLHRAGRTARAGRAGTVTSLVLSKQAHHFRHMMRQAERGSRKVAIKNMSMLAENRKVTSDTINEALQLLRVVIDRENLGLISEQTPVPDLVLHDLWTSKSNDAVKKRSPSPMQSLPEENSEYGHRKKFLKRNASSALDILSDGEETSQTYPEKQLAIVEDTLSALLHSQITRNILWEAQHE